MQRTGVVAAFLALAGMAHAAGPTTLRVTITDSSVQVAPLQVSTTSVVLRIANRSSRPRTLSVAGHSTPLIAPGRSAMLSVTSLKTREYLALSYAARHTRPLSGFFTVAVACGGGATATVDVKMM